MADFRVPTLLAVGLEGLWGCGVCAVALPLLEAVRVGPGHRPLDSAAQVRGRGGGGWRGRGRGRVA